MKTTEYSLLFPGGREKKNSDKNGFFSLYKTQKLGVFSSRVEEEMILRRQTEGKREIFEEKLAEKRAISTSS